MLSNQEPISELLKKSMEKSEIGYRFEFQVEGTLEHHQVKSDSNCIQVRKGFQRSVLLQNQLTTLVPNHPPKCCLQNDLEMGFKK